MKVQNQESNSGFMQEFIIGSIVLVLLYVIYQIYDYSKSVKRAEQNVKQEITQQDKPSPNPEKLEISKLKLMTLKDVQDNDGKKSKTIYVAIKNFVFDVSTSDSYAPNGPYSSFAGHDASISLGKMDVSDKYLDQYGQISQPEDEIQNMNSWFSYFYSRYPIIGRIEDKKLD